jgi:hypothetical protein
MALVDLLIFISSHVGRVQEHFDGSVSAFLNGKYQRRVPIISCLIIEIYLANLQLTLLFQLGIFLHSIKIKQ